MDEPDFRVEILAIRLPRKVKKRNPVKEVKE